MRTLIFVLLLAASAPERSSVVDKWQPLKDESELRKVFEAARIVDCSGFREGQERRYDHPDRNVRCWKPSGAFSNTWVGTVRGNPAHKVWCGKVTVQKKYGTWPE